MDKETVLAVIQKLLDERDDLLLQRLDIRLKIEELEQTDLALERALVDRRAAGRVFGQNIAVPMEPEFFESYETLEREMKRLRSGRAWKPGESKPTSDTLKKLDQANTSGELVDPESGDVSPIEKPQERIRDRVLDFLKRAGSNGSKSAPMRTYLEEVHGQKTHEKTVGMTLYRLQKEGLVGRNGHVWFLIQPKAEEENPGTANTGAQ